MSSASLSKQIKKLKEKLAELKTGLDKRKHKTIEECTKKRHLKDFSVVELIAWLTQNGVSLKKINKKHHLDFVELAWETLEEEYETESDSDSDSSDSETDSSSSDDSS